MDRVYFKYIALILSLFVWIACKRPDELGPELITPSEGLKFTDSLKVFSKGVKKSDLTNFDFSKDSLQFKAKFNQRVNWQLTLKGITSLSEKVYEGADSVINVKYSGDSDNAFLFKKGDQISAILTVFQSELTDTFTYVISNEKKYDIVLVNDFDGSGLFRDWWNSFKPNELRRWTPNYRDEVVPQGLNALFFSGVDEGPDNFLGITGHASAGQFITQDKVEEYKYDGSLENLYFNFYLKGEKSTRVEARLIQTDSTGISSEGIIQYNSEGQEFSFFINIDWEGWRLLSVPYSKFNRTGGIFGSPFKDPRKITRVKFVLRNLIDGGPASAAIDMPCFTFNEPFEP